MVTEKLFFSTVGNCDVIEITKDVENIVCNNKVTDAVVFISVIGSTAGLTTMEYERGLERDIKEQFDKLFPYSKDYEHNKTWSDDNGHSHLRSSFIKTNIFVSVTDSKLDLGTWQQIVLIDFDTRPRKREIIVKIMR